MIEELRKYEEAVISGLSGYENEDQFWEVVVVVVEESIPGLLVY